MSPQQPGPGVAPLAPRRALGSVPSVAHLAAMSSLAETNPEPTRPRQGATEQRRGPSRKWPSRKAISETAILGLTGTAIWLANSGPAWALWAGPFGLASQYFWIRDTRRNREWGKFWLSWWFALAWFRALCKLLGWPDPVALVFG
ncbi:MAG: hypothetical protein KQI62_02135 [Deltaproteobacteria bacterium]|nr:hypothetical protein [Deltaproteobacteria bacterium]